MPERVALREIAIQCGCTIATVSRALRDRPEISANRRAEIKKVAVKLGYVPDPALSALVHHRQRLRSERFLETIGLISPELSWNQTKALPRRMELVSAIKERANALGYKVEFIHLPTDDKQRQSTSRILARRGIRGLIILPSNPPAEELKFPWENFTAIRLYRPPENLKFTTVDTDLYQGISLLWKKIASSAYERPGLIMPELVDRYTGETWPRYLALMNFESKDISPVPRFVFRGNLISKSEQKRLLNWIKTEQLDLLLSFQALDVVEVLHQLSLNVPETIGLIDLDVEREGELSGLMQSRIAIGKTAIDQLHSLLLSNTLGFPEYPVTVKTAFNWVDGYSLMKQ